MPTREELAAAIPQQQPAPQTDFSINPDSVLGQGWQGLKNRFVKAATPPPTAAPYAQQDAVAPQPDQGAVQQTQDAAAGYPDSAAGLPGVIPAGMQQSASMGGMAGMDKEAGYDALKKFEGREAAIEGKVDAADKAASDASLKEAESMRAYQTELGRRQNELDGKAVVAAQDYENGLADINQRASEATRQQMDRVNAASAAAGNYQFKDFFASRSTMGTIMGLLSAAIGGGVNGLQGHAGSPTALDRVIAQDWEQQKTQYQQLRDNVSDQKTLFQELMQQTGDERNAYLAFHNAVVAKFETMGKQIVSGMSDQLAQANFQQVLAKSQKDTADRTSKAAGMMQQASVAEMAQETRISLASERAFAARMAKMQANAESLLRPAGVELGNYTGSDVKGITGQISHGEQAIQLIDTMLAHRDISQDAARGERLGHLIAAASTQDARALIAKAKSITTGYYKSDMDAPEGGNTMGGTIAHALGKNAGRAYNTYGESDAEYKTRLRELRAEVLGELQGQIRNRGGIIAPRLPSGQKNFLYDGKLHEQQWLQYVDQLRGGRLPDKPVIKDTGNTMDASYGGEDL